MQLVDIVVTEELPPVFLDVVEVAGVTRERIAMTSRINTSPAKLLGFLICQIPSVTLVEDTVSKRASGANGEKIALQTGPV